jgi:hypothetical protein
VTLRTRLIAASAALALAAAAPAAASVEIEGVRFAPRVEVGDRTLELRSVGLLRYRAIFKGYAAALYAEAGVAAEALLGDVPKRLELEYFWSIDGSKFGPAAEAVLARTLDPAAFVRIRPGLDRLHAAYEDVAPGDRYALTYVPGRGTELALNGQPKLVVPGAELAAAYFGIWLGREPLDASLRDQLLGLR